MSHSFKGPGGAGLAANKVLHALVVFPKINITTWHKHNHGHTVNPLQYAESTSNTVRNHYASLETNFKRGTPFDKTKFRNQEHFMSISTPGGTLNMLCVAFFAGLGHTKGVSGIFAKRRAHAVSTQVKKTVWHEIQFVHDGTVVCVWKLEADGVKHGNLHSQNMQAAIAEVTSDFSNIFRAGKAKAAA